MPTLLVLHADFEAHWPFVGERFIALWRYRDELDLLRLPRGDARRLGQAVAEPGRYRRLVALGVPVTVDCLRGFRTLEEAAIHGIYGASSLGAEGRAYLAAQGIALIEHDSEGFWGQSVAEFALALTLASLRRIPQHYHEMLTSHEPWLRYRPERNQGPGTWGAQFSDDVRFTHGTLAGKRVRIVGAGNIGSRYASFAHLLGADVAAWDPYAPEPSFHRAGARRVHRLDELLRDAEVCAPMLPLTEQTRGLITAAHIAALPRGCLVVLATRAGICDMSSLRRRVLADELALAADVFDVEPLPLDDPLLGRDNVVHTPHLAGRTRDANYQWADDLAARFRRTAETDMDGQDAQDG